MDKLDQLLALYTGRCVDDEAEYFLSVDVSGIEYNEEIKKRMLRYAFKRSRYERKRYAVKMILVACLVAMSVVFTACVSIPKIREAIWGAVIEWYDDHISVKFEEITEQPIETSEPIKTDTGKTSAVVTDEVATSVQIEAIVIPPKTIEHRAYVASLPEGYYAEEGVESTIDRDVNFYDANGVWVFWLYQKVITGDPTFLDSENQNIIEIKINNNIAFLLKDTSSENFYTVIWTDGLYEYTIYGIFNSVDELIDIAECVELK